MLNYEIHMGQKEIELLETQIQGDHHLKNPFPGLRPFGIDECHLFFGRESQVDEVLVKLAENKFIGLLGYSGSGKSSFMYCGIVPILLGGFMTEAGPNWNIVVTRPGVSPIDNLAEALLQNDPEYANGDEGDRLIKRTVASSFLKGGASGLVDLARRFTMTGDNLLIVVDQFEEIFRYRNEQADDNSVNESAAFVNLLIETIKQEDLPIYLTLSMRSDFIGDCSQFHGLTELINTSNYLVPQMTREQKRIAIEGPVAVGGGKISNRLVKRLLAEIGDNQDQLPVMQHALMRTWDYWIENHDSGEPMDFRHYNAVGKISEALSQHANEAFDELSSRQKIICEILFKTLTEKGTDGFGLRRPASLGEISEIAGVDETEVVAVVDQFRRAGRSLLMPPISVELNSESIVEISHESLMRIWTRLKNWVDEENESAQMYLRLSEAAAMYQIGRTGLWRPPDLQLALNWQQKQNPSRVWAKRYDEAFERTIVFLDTSRITYEAEQKNQQLMQQRLLKRTRNVAILFGAFGIVAILLFVFSFSKQIEAEQATELALANEALADAARIDAEASAEDARIATLDAEEQTKLALEANEATEAALAQEQESANRAFAAQKIAEEQTQVARNALDRAQISEGRALESAEEARKATQERLRALMISRSQVAALKSLQLNDNDLQALLALQAFQINEQYDGDPYDKYIYDGLYYALSNFKGSDWNEGVYHTGSVRSVDFGATSAMAYSTSMDGKVLEWDVAGMTATTIGENVGYGNQVVETSPDGKWLAVGSDSSNIMLYNLIDRGEPKIITGHNSRVFDIVFESNSAGFYSIGGDKMLRYSNLATSELIHTFTSKVEDIDINKSNIVAGTYDGKVIMIDVKSRNVQTLVSNETNPITAIAISPTGTNIAYGMQDGIAKVYSIPLGAEVNELGGHTATIVDMEFSPDGTMVATAGWDGKVQMWITNNLNGFPIEMRDNSDKVMNIAFSPDGDYLLAGTLTGMVKKWPTSPKAFADNFCDELTRKTFRQKEWEKYWGDTPFRNTCLIEFN